MRAVHELRASTARLRVVLVYALAGSLWILGSDWLLAQLIPDPTTRALVGTVKGWGFVGLSSLLLWGLLGGWRVGSRTPSRALRRRMRASVALVAGIALASMVGLALVEAHRNLQDHRQQAMEVQGEAVAHAVEDWLQQRRTDAATYQSSRFYATLYDEWRHPRPGQAENKDLLNRLAELRQIKAWTAVALFGASGELQWSSPQEDGQRLDWLADTVRRATAPQAVATSEPQRDALGRTVLAIATSLASSERSDHPVLATVLDIDRALASVLRRPEQLTPWAEAVLLIPQGKQWQTLRADGSRLVLRTLPAGVLPDSLSPGVVQGVREAGGGAYTGMVRRVAGTNWWVMVSTDGRSGWLETLRSSAWIGLSAVFAVLITAVMFALRSRDEMLARATQEQLHQSERLRTLMMLDAVMDGAGVVVVLQDLEGRALLCNAEAARVAGLKAPVTQGTVLEGVLPAEMLGTTAQVPQWRSAITDERWSTPVGPRIFSVTRGPLRDESGGPFGHYAVARDVTAQRENAAALARSEQQLALALHGAELGLWDWHIPSGHVEINHRWAEMLGYREEDVDASVRAWEALVHPDDWPAVNAALKPHLEGLTLSYRCEHRLRHRDGHWVWVLDAGRVVERDANGQAVRAVGIHLDITDRRAAQVALERSRAELEQRVVERTEQLAGATRLAESANRAKSAFLANMSHEIRTPMNAIIGLSRMLAGTATDARQADRIGKIERAAEHLMALINDVLDLSKIEAGGLTLEKVPFSVQEVLEQVRALVALQAEARGLHLSFDTAALPDLLLGDPTRLSQALLNLVGNAVKFTHHGAVTVRVRPSPGNVSAGDPGLNLLFEVEDTGIGLASDQIERLFRPFVQADASTTRHFGGTGLGLAITRRLVSLMGGEVGVDSKPGQGSRFWFTVQFEPVPEEGMGPRPRSDVLPILLARHAGRTVLVVDDDPTNLEVARALLEATGMQVLTAESGTEVVRMCREQDVDLVLMDLHMPGMDGLSATHALHEAGLDMPVVAITASTFDEDRQRCVAAGMDGFIAKPLDPPVVYRTVLEVLDADLVRRGGGTRQATRPPAPADPTAVRALLKRLLLKLERGDAGARELVVEHGAELLASLGAQGRRLVDCVLRFDLEEARGIALALLNAPAA